MTSEQAYATFVSDLIGWLLERDDVIDARQMNAYTVQATLSPGGERLDFAMQWRPAELTRDFVERNDVVVVRPTKRGG